MNRAWLSGVCAVLAMALSLGCGGAPAKSALPARPIDEGRAVKLIAASLHQQGLEAAPGRKIKIGASEILMDVSVEGRRFGIVYMSPSDAHDLGDNPIAKKKQIPGDPLQEQSAADDEGALTCIVLYATDYMYDDQEGADHDNTMITAENKIDRDVRDIVMASRKNHWK